MDATLDIMDGIAKNVDNSTRLLNECVREHLGVPWWEEWWQWGLDIWNNRVPKDAEFVRPTTYAQWLQPQYIMMIVSYLLCHVIDWVDARAGSKLCKTYGIKHNALTKVSLYTRQNRIAFS